MDENSSTRSLLYRSLNLLSTDELEEVLRTNRLITGDMASDEEALITITDILLERENKPAGLAEQETEAALEAFWRDTAQDEENHARAVNSVRKPVKHRWKRWLVGVAAVLAIGIPTAQALDFNLIYIVQQLISGQFSFSSNTRTADVSDVVKLQKALDKENISVSLKELWIPDGYFVSESANLVYSDFEIFQLRLLNSVNKWILIDIVRYEDSTYNRQTETIDQASETYYAGDRLFYILCNETNISAACFENNIEITVYGDIITEDLYKIIDSIG